MKLKSVPLALCATVLSYAVGATAAGATGITAGTVIQNTASATYSTGAVTTSVQSNTVSVTVSQLLDVAVAGLNSVPVVANATPAVLTFAVTNTGNGADTFNLAVDPAVPGNPFNGVIQSIAVDTNGNGVYDQGTDQVVTNGQASPAITPDASLRVFVVVSLPANATDGQISKVKLTATSKIGSGAPGTTFTGAGTGGVDAVVGSSRATSGAQEQSIASLAGVTLTKSAVILDRFGGTSPLPGALVTYAITAHVSGTGTVTGLHVTDVIPAGTTYQPGTLKLDGAALTDGVDADAGKADAAGIDVTIGTMAPAAANKIVQFAVKIN